MLTALLVVLAVVGVALLIGVSVILALALKEKLELIESEIDRIREGQRTPVHGFDISSMHPNTIRCESLYTIHNNTISKNPEPGTWQYMAKRNEDRINDLNSRLQDLKDIVYDEDDGEEFYEPIERRVRDLEKRMENQDHCQFVIATRLNKAGIPQFTVDDEKLIDNESEDAEED